MSGDRLTPLQRKILETLSGLEPPFVLSGGGALVAVHLEHRETRDLDLFFRDRDQLGDIGALVRDRLRDSGFDVTELRRSPQFQQLRVSQGQDGCVVDLVAEPIGAMEEPLEARVGGSSVWVATAYEILVDKLCTLLSRSEIRDLEDVRVLVERGGDLERALIEAPQKDAGFSPLTLAWTLKSFPVRSLGAASGWSEERIAASEAFREELVELLLVKAGGE